MTSPAADQAAWAARVAHVGIRLDLLEGGAAHDDFPLLEDAVLRVVRGAALSDQDLYPVLVKFWTGRAPQVNWPLNAPTVARRCATILAARRPCALTVASRAPSRQSLQEAREAIVTYLGLTPKELLSTLADHWTELAELDAPRDQGRSLLAFAEHVLLEPVVGACAVIWSALDTQAAGRADGWGEWSPLATASWPDLVRAELSRLGRAGQQVSDDPNQAAALLASTLAAILNEGGDAALVAASITRTSGWPDDHEIIGPLTTQALDLALQHLEDLDPDAENDDLVDAIQRSVMPAPEILLGWAREPSFGTLGVPSGTARTGQEMLNQAARWLTWSLSATAVEIASAMRGPATAR